MKQTAELKNVFFTFDGANIRVVGNIFNDTFKRFPDDKRVLTSRVLVTQIKGDDFYIETENTHYKVINFAEQSGSESLPEYSKLIIGWIRQLSQEQLKDRLMISSSANTLNTLKRKRKNSDRKNNFKAVKRLVNEIKMVRECYHKSSYNLNQYRTDKKRLKHQLDMINKVLNIMEIYNGKAN